MLEERARGLEAYEQAAANVRASGSDGVSIIILCDFAGWLIFQGETERDRELLQEALSIAAGQSRFLLAATTILGLALVDASEGVAESAARRLGAVDALAVQIGLFFPVHYQERIDRAAELARDALGEKLYARMWAEGRTDPSAVVAAAIEQSAAATTTAFPNDLASAHELGLSRREREMLLLLSDGKTDREIATALYISPRTVSSHVGAVLHKLNASTRAEAAVLAVRLGFA